MFNIKYYSPEFKQDVVAFATAHPDLSYGKIAKNFGVAESVARDWIHKAGVVREKVHTVWLNETQKKWADYIREHRRDGVVALMQATGLSWVGVCSVARKLKITIERKQRTFEPREKTHSDFIYEPLEEARVKSCERCAMRTNACIYGFPRFTARCLQFRQLALFSA